MNTPPIQVGFVRRGEDAHLRSTLRFPYPFAGWSNSREGNGFWWEDVLQSFIGNIGIIRVYYYYYYCYYVQPTPSPDGQILERETASSGRTSFRAS